MTKYQKSIYNDDKTELLQIGYTNICEGVFRIEKINSKTKRVPSILPKEITDLSEAFGDCKFKKIHGLESWDTTNITNMSDMFRNASLFNQDIKHFETCNVTNMFRMFSGAEAFNNDISNWNVLKVDNHSFFDFQTSKTWKPKMKPMFEAKKTNHSF